MISVLFMLGGQTSLWGSCQPEFQMWHRIQVAPTQRSSRLSAIFMLTLLMVDQWGTTLKPVPHSTDPSLMPSSTEQLTCPLGQVGNRLRNFFQYITYLRCTLHSLTLFSLCRLLQLMNNSICLAKWHYLQVCRERHMIANMSQYLITHITWPLNNGYFFR